jgi:ribonuclease T2
MMSIKKIFILIAFVVSAYVGFRYFTQPEPKNTGREKAGTSPKNTSAATGYVFALSWSPAYCLHNAYRPSAKTQCDPNDGKQYRFIIHGLWPGAGKKRLAFCSPRAEQRVTSRNIAKIFDLSPSASLIGHQWRKHGTCSGLTQDQYIAKTLEAYRKFTPPSFYLNVSGEKKIDAIQVKQDFITTHAIKGLTDQSVQIHCDRNRLREVRICTDLHLQPVTCPEKPDLSCERKRLTLPAPI